MTDADLQASEVLLTTHDDGQTTTIRIRGESWQQDLLSPGCTGFRFEHASGTFTARREWKNGRSYWYAYRRTGGRLRKAYLGKRERLTLTRLVSVAAKLGGLADTGSATMFTRTNRAPERPRLPAWRDPLIGRVRELALVAELLVRKDVGLVTLTGAGGSGKTRLAATLAADLGDRFADGVCFVPLAPIQSPALVASAIAQTLGVHESGDRPLVESLIAYLQGRHVLLVLDNFEHLLPAAPLLPELLAACPDLTILVTSRAVLRVTGEHDVMVPPLGLPQCSPVARPEDIVQSEAVRLFIDRARAARFDFAVSSANAPAVAAICSRLDGLPLAIELAASQIRLLPAQAMLTRLDRRLPLLVGGARDLPTRQQTLHGAISWSHDLLSDGERVLFRRLSVFVGGCSLAGVEAVIERVRQQAGERDAETLTSPTAVRPPSPPDVLEGLKLLIDKSLLRQEEQPDGEPRYMMLETIREYAIEQLEASGEADLVRRCHAEHFLTLAEAAEAQFWGPNLAVWTERLGLEIDNVRAALAWCSATTSTSDARLHAHREPALMGLALAAALGRFWDVLGRIGEGREWLAALLDRAPGRTAVRARGLNAAGFLAWTQGDTVAARRLLEEGLELAQEHDNPEQVAFALVFLGCSLRQAGDLELALSLLEGSVPWWVRAASPGGQSLALFWLADVLRAVGDHERARTCLEQGLELSAQLDDRFGTAFQVAALGRLSLSQGDYVRATRLLRQALSLWRDLGDLRDVGVGLDGLALAAVAQGQACRAAWLFGAAAAVTDRPDLVRNPIWEDDHVRAAEATRISLGEERFLAAWEEGRAVPLDVAIETALKSGDPASFVESRRPNVPTSVAGVKSPVLSRRQSQVACLIARGYSNREIAQELVIVDRTVETHITHILSKLALRSRAQIAAWAVQNGLPVTTEHSAG